MTSSLSKQEEKRQRSLSRQNTDIRLHFACGTWLDRNFQNELLVGFWRDNRDIPQIKRQLMG